MSAAWDKRSVFVTGAYGLLGGWLVRALLERDARVTVLRRDDAAASFLRLEGLEAQCTVVGGDLVQGDLMRRILGEKEIDTVFHLAAQTIVGAARRSPVSTFESNIRGTWTLLEACRLHGIERAVVASSDKSYGTHEELPYREDFPLDARFPYDVSKAAADMISRSYFHIFALPVAVTRFANLYGGGDLNWSRLIPETVSAVLADRPPVIRSDGSPERDYLYVEDAVAAYLAIADLLDAGRAGGEAYNAGSGRSWAVREVVSLLCEVAGSGVEPDIRGRGTPPGEIDRQWVDFAKLRDAAGWEPTVDLAEGLRRTVQWYRAHPGVSAP